MVTSPHVDVTAVYLEGLRGEKWMRTEHEVAESQSVYACP